MSTHVLVIGDKFESMLVELILEKARGDQVVVVESAQEAFEYLAQEMPDLVVFAYRWIKLVSDESAETLSKRVEVIDLYKQFLKRWPDWRIPTLATTACLEYDAVAKAVGLTGHIVWPLSPYELIAACEAVLRGEKYFKK